MRKRTDIARLETGVRNLDELLVGGIPKGSVVVIAGPPGAGKTILAQQICFHNAGPERRVLYFSTLSEPVAKTLRYLQQFQHFDTAKLDQGIEFVDLGAIVRSRGLEEAGHMVMDHVKRIKPAIVVIDSFKVFDDLTSSREELRKFGYQLAIDLMAWETTTFLLGEFGPGDIQGNPLFSIADGLILVTQRQQSGENQRFVQIVKMRGAAHSRDEHSFLITSAGIEVFAPRVTIHRNDIAPSPPRLRTRISKLDDLLGDGIPRGSSVLVTGVAGTGKTMLSLEFVYRGAQAGEKGIYFSFEETDERLRAFARTLGWELDAEIARGNVEIVFIPQPEIQVEKHLLMMKERVEAMGAMRVAVDSVSVFLHKVVDPQIAREKIFQLVSVVQNAQAVALLATDIPYGTDRISRFGVEETVVDGVIVLSSTQEGLERHRYIEIYKLRNTAHLKGRHSMLVGGGGITVYPRYDPDTLLAEPPAPIEAARRAPFGVPSLDALFDGGPLERSVTLLSGSPGIGKSMLAAQFIAEGGRRKEPSLYVALEEGPAQILQSAKSLGMPLEEATRDGICEIVYLSRERVRPSQLLSILTDKIRAQGTRRLVIDSANHLATEGMTDDELRQLLYALVVRFKKLGVTSLITLESAEMYSSESISDRQFSPVADNLVLLRYARSSGGIRPTITIVKTRGSKHDFGTYDFGVFEGGVRIGAPIDIPTPARQQPPSGGDEEAP